MNETSTPYRITSTSIEHGILHLQLTPQTGSVFPFTAGQYATLLFKEGEGASFERSFSITSSPLTTNHLEFGIRVLGNYTHKLAALPANTILQVRGPFGEFSFDPVRNPDLVFIAGGIGITPFLSMLRYIADAGLRNRVTLLYSNKKLAEIPYLAELEELAAVTPNLTIHYFLTDDAPGPQRYQNVFYQRIDRAWLAANLHSINNPHFFLCGPSPFMDATRENLISLGTPEEIIHQEDFSFAPPKIRKSDLLFYLGGLGAASAVTILLLILVYQSEVAKAATASQIITPTVTATAQTSTPTYAAAPSTTQTAPQTSSNTSSYSSPTVTQTPTPTVRQRSSLS